ncbi:hypothetical protein GALMADRAFT_1049874 [Galerina marginata CBS 339.88]|uniref:Uncharacterized protein n=1 Tax=Galerina marginata (strain CBS 339.88) TaxID=685588 RepID=A0A067SBJ9_GALM3|nr:hypothetical protein GALMADRAFT_1049874 [Galerina marginata CBS 339.88]
MSLLWRNEVTSSLLRPLLPLQVALQAKEYHIQPVFSAPLRRLWPLPCHTLRPAMGQRAPIAQLAPTIPSFPERARRPSSLNPCDAYMPPLPHFLIATSIHRLAPCFELNLQCLSLTCH